MLKQLPSDGNGLVLFEAGTFCLKLVDLHTMVHRGIPQGFPGAGGALHKNQIDGGVGIVHSFFHIGI